ncbi:MAG: hypothetical protein KDA72_01225 [Planctomycetales bacterium]|nr:hypothetical protein [Planctomycetales bacterium]
MTLRVHWKLICIVTLCGNAGLEYSPTSAQEIPTAPQGGYVQAMAPIAIAGEPFGVLRVEVPLPTALSSGPPRVLVEESHGRLFYPAIVVRTIEAVEQQPASGIGRRGGLIDRLRKVVRGQPQKRQVPVAITVSALFRGDEPIELHFTGDIEQRVRIDPSSSVASSVLGVGATSVSHAALLGQWWTAYTQSARQALAEDDFPKLVHKVLVSMLGARLNLPAVDLDPADEDEEELSQPLKTLALLSAIEPLREEILDEVLAAPAPAAVPNLPLPPEPIWEPAELPPVPADVVIESLATRVPPECFYLRFGSFSNYVWFQELTERYGGDIAQSVLLRGFNYDASARMERMLATKLTAIAKMFGDKLIGDMAIVGSDMYMKEGASVGVMLLATNPQLLTASMESERKAVLAKNTDASLTEVTIAGRQVSLLSTPDNRIRSFQAIDGPYIFTSTSRTLVRRFLEVGQGAPALADSPSFRWARSWMPDANNYSIFAYFSPEFFHRLVSPQYQIELRRRLAAIAHLEIAEVATAVAKSEGIEPLDLDSMKSAGLLSPWFDERVDGARTLRSDAGFIDSMRGARGSFLPIADVELTTVNPIEAEGYANIAQFYQDQWRHMDPLLMGLRRFRADGSRTEQVAVEAYIAPFEPKKYGWIARQLGAPTPVEVKLPADDAAALQIHVRGSNTLGISSADYHLFGGVKDMIPPDAEDTQGLIKIFQALRAAPAYIGGWPRPGILEQLPLGIGLVHPDAAGFSRMIGGLWRWQDEQFSLLSFDRSILEQAIPQLGVSQTQDLAQVRARVANLTGSRLATWINQQWYIRAWKASQGNSRLLDTIGQQLKVPSADCLTVAQRLLDVRLQCPLGGTYQFQPQSSQSQADGASATASHGGWWTSTAWSEATFDNRGKPVPPPSYSAPWIDWFRGGKVHVTQGADSLALVGSIELEMQPLAVQHDPQLPSMLPTMNFDLFSLPTQLFGTKNKADEKPTTQSF